MSIASLRTAVTTAGGTPSRFDTIGLLRELLTAKGAPPTQFSEIGLLREAITAWGGSPSTFQRVDLWRQFVTVLGGTPASRDIDALQAQAAPLAVSSLTPQVISNYANTTVTSLGGDLYLVQKTAGAAAYDAAIKGSRTFPGGFEIWYKHANNTGADNTMNSMIGADAADVSTTGFADMDFAAGSDSTSFTLYQNGASTGITGVLSPSSWRCVRRVGSTLTFLENTSMTTTGATLKGTFPNTSSAPLYLKGSLYNPNNYIRIYAL